MVAFFKGSDMLETFSFEGHGMMKTLLLKSAGKYLIQLKVVSMLGIFEHA